MKNRDEWLGFQKFVFTAGLLISVFMFSMEASAASITPVFINEIHYENEGADKHEGVEIVGPAGTDLDGWSLVLYRNNGLNTGVTYGTISLSNTLNNDTNGFGFRKFSIEPLQNGPQDGLALIDHGTVVQLLSYEGVFTATNGSASGMTSTDIGVFESSSTNEDHSLQLTGSGNMYEDFSWLAPTEETFGHVNFNQTFTAPVPIPSTLSLMGLGLFGIGLIHALSLKHEL